MDNKLEKEIDAEETKISNQEFKEFNQTKRLLQRRKVDILDKHIFRSMANLILFFEYLSKYPQLRDLFEEDIKELLGFIGPNAKYEDNIITRILQSILTWDREEDLNNFRLELMSSIQNILFNKITVLSLFDKRMTSVTNEVVVPDMGRARAWCRMFSSVYSYELKKEDQAKRPNRYIQF